MTSPDAGVFLRRDTCPACGGSPGAALVSVPYTAPPVWGFLERYYGGRASPELLEGARYEVLPCGRCGLLWERNAPVGPLAEALYEVWVSPEESLRKKQRARASLFMGYAREMLAVSRLLGRDPWDVAVLDFGMGWGYWCRMAAAFGFDVWGHELSERRVRHAEGLGVRVIRDLRGAGQRFDFVNAVQVFEHLPDPAGTLRSLVGLLKEGGVIRIDVPDGTGAGKALRSPGWAPSKGPVQPLEHVNCFTGRALEALGAAAGLEPLPRRRVREALDERSPRPWRRAVPTRLWFTRGEGSGAGS